MKKKIEQLEKRIDVLSEMLRKRIEKPEIWKWNCQNCINPAACNGCQRGGRWNTQPKYKEPIIGQLAIFWTDNKKNQAVVGVYLLMVNGCFCFCIVDNTYITFKNAILFESVEQYKTFLKS